MFFWSLLLFLSILKTPVLAEKDFNISENIEYLVNSQGSATVTHQVQIINNFSQIYPKEYQIDIQGLPLSDLSATDNQGNILSIFTTENDISKIKLKFNEPKLGKDQVTTFKLSYRIENLAKNKGKTWEISLPQSIDTSLNKSQIILKVPLEFGGLSFSSIPSNLVSNSTHQIINFQNNSSKKILVIFGDYQLFNFTLDYYLKNPSDSPTESQIAIIPQTYSQSVLYESISPPPKTVTTDSDGNWLATYQLQGNEALEIKAVGQVKTGLNLPSKTDNLSPYLQEQPFWPISSTEIRDISKTLSTPKTIYDYVVNNLDYNYDGINSAKRQGAIAALQNPKNSLCTEFTDLFIAISRAKGIPAREIEGFAYSTNPKIKPLNIENDILHAWPEYYDQNKGGWKAIDPTWAKTTNGINYFDDLDLNHITFVIHGENSQYPPPPGSYKKPGLAKSVNIEFASTEIITEGTLPHISIENKKLIIKNDGPNPQNNLQIDIPKLKFSETLTQILPYSQTSLSLPSLSFWQSLSANNQNIAINLENSSHLTQTINLKYLPHFINLGTFIIASIVILALSGIIITSKTHEKNS